MTWQYRVMRVNDQLTVHEVYYGEDSSVLRAYSANPTYPRGCDIEELADDLIRYQEALSLPVLVPEDFNR